MNPNSVHHQPSWTQRRRTAVLASLLSAAALGWTAVALSVHTTGSAALDPDRVTDADVARLGATVMAGIAALAAGLWWRHWATVSRPLVGGGSARGAFAVSALHSLFVVPVILLASWEWKALAIAFTCAVLAAGVREAADVTGRATEAFA
ncbi:hypothetical protein SAMN05428944_0475 [Streptomyces sp. 1222.5]|uniref:hypothetical protein n=1 Tax=unclassified Streptomyces TaxID=2593676 RepID=UPI0008981FCF|nr:MULTISPECIES: hypothetical protein [unclassified Streptomyces]PKW12276.1 hypothetical protein BX260_7621 [Streptomyces sp. 5112.2]SEB59283.1 hypothetical protein SAMN05428944_0475 [Streptomyces sp. 1222.5]SEE35136.1 hypothetical protein SAMN05216532_7874 [Streptomyces sp. 2231.1]